MKELVVQGKIKHIGISNETPWGTMRFLEAHKIYELPKAITVQNPYNLLNRQYEVGMSEISIRENVGLLAYSPMAFGALSGKYLGGKKPQGSRISLFPNFDRYIGKNASRATEEYYNLAKENNLSLVQMALAFVNTRPFVTSNIIGATNLVQLKENIASIDITLTDAVLESIEEIHNNIPNPAP